MSTSGHLTDFDLVTVPGGRLEPATALAWNAMRAAALRESAVTLTIVQPRAAVAANTPGSYRSRATSLDMRARPALYNITPGILPGIPSEHEDGDAIDVGAGLAWCTANDDANLHRFGFVRTKLAIGDKNHIKHVGTAPADSGSTAITTEEQEEDDMATKPIYYVATGNNKTVTVGKGDIWVRSAPGEPLRRMTQGQASDFWALDGLDLNSPNVHQMPPEWFDAAFAEDRTVARLNALTHPS